MYANSGAAVAEHKQFNLCKVQHSVKMQRSSRTSSDDQRRALREKALAHKLFYLRLEGGTRGRAPPTPETTAATSRNTTANSRVNPTRPSAAATASRNSRAQRARVTALVEHYGSLGAATEAPKTHMELLRPPVPRPRDDICSSDDEDRLAVRSRDLSDDSAVELEAPIPKCRSLSLIPIPPGETLVEAGIAEDAGRRVRTPSVVVSDYSDALPGTTAAEAARLRARAPSSDSARSSLSACSSCSTLSGRDDDDQHHDTFLALKKIIKPEGNYAS